MLHWSHETHDPPNSNIYNMIYPIPGVPACLVVEARIALPSKPLRSRCWAPTGSQQKDHPIAMASNLIAIKTSVCMKMRRLPQNFFGRRKVDTDPLVGCLPINVARSQKKTTALFPLSVRVGQHTPHSLHL